jgi:hypothetical protein
MSLHGLWPGSAPQVFDVGQGKGDVLLDVGRDLL